MNLKIGVIKGDGIGPEIVTEAMKVLNKVAEVYGHTCDYTQLLMGGASIDVHGVPLTDETIAEAKACDAVLMGSIGGDAKTSPWYKLEPSKRPEAGLLKIRKALNLFANLRPAVLYDELKGACPLKEEITEGGFDMMIMRELTGGLYFGERKTEEVNGVMTAQDSLTYNEEEIRRIAKRGFDIAMKRADYEKFIKVCESELDQQKFFLQTGRTEKYYCFSFAKVQLKGTEILEDFSKDVNIRHGIFVDIFPYDNLPDNIIRRYIFLAINHLFKNLLWTKCGYGVSWQKKKFSYILSRIGGSVFSIDKLKQLRDAHIKKYNSVNTEYCFNSDYPKNHLNNLLFMRKKKYVFENKRFWGFEDSDNFLKTLYGPTYMELPPEEDRKEHSKYKINFGDYQ